MCLCKRCISIRKCKGSTRTHTHAHYHINTRTQRLTHLNIWHMSTCLVCVCGWVSILPVCVCVRHRLCVCLTQLRGGLLLCVRHEHRRRFQHCCRRGNPPVYPSPLHSIIPHTLNALIPPTARIRRKNSEASSVVAAAAAADMLWDHKSRNIFSWS